MKIGFTYDLKEDWVATANEPSDASAEFDKPKTVDGIIEALEQNGHEVKRIGGVRSLLKQVNDLDVDIVFNICEGVSGRNRESQVPLILEMNQIPYVGSDALALGISLDKSAAKKCFVADGVRTARYFVARSVADLKKMPDLPFPLFVKPCYEGTSKSISDNSCVRDMAGLKRQVALITENYRQPALIEQFIKGYECTVAVLGNDEPEAMPVAQVQINGRVDLGDRFYKNTDVYSSDSGYVCPAQFPEDVLAEVQELAVGAYKAIGCRDFGRVDFRVDENLVPYVLEINPLPYLGKEDVFNYFPKVIGSTYEETINRILNFACERYGLVSAETASGVEVS